MNPTRYSKHCCLILITLLGLSGVHAQNWTWVNGDSIPNLPSVYGSFDPVFKPGARIMATTWTDNQQKMWLFGGLGNDADGALGQLNDLWKYDPQINRWSWVKGSNHIYQTGNYVNQGSPSAFAYPGARTGAISWTDLSGNLWLYGGSAFVDGYTLTFSDLWKFSPATESWTWVSGTHNQPAVYGTIGVQSPANTPGERFNSVSWTDDTGHLWLFGGNTAVNAKSDLWKYDPAANQWTWMQGSDLDDQSGQYGQLGVPDPANTPGVRSNTLCFKDQSNHFWLFGGFGKGTSCSPGGLNDLWKYDLSLNQWTWMSGSSTPDHPGVYGTQGQSGANNTPGSRMHINGWIDSTGNVWVFGGMATTPINQIPGRLNDLWKYDTNLNQWTWIKGANTNDANSTYGQLLVPDPANTPGARDVFMTWSNHSGLWLFGGLGTPGSAAQDFGYQNDLWRFGADTLVPMDPAALPLADDFAMPNVFSPNGDGLNDLFLKPGLSATSHTVTVINRWGEVVFQTSEPTESWDGTSSGQPCTEGVYFWNVKRTDAAGKAVVSSGCVTLVR